MALHFEWDHDKALRNLRKHSVSFEEVQELFTSGGEYLEIYDLEHSQDEDRFICIGPIARGIVLVVVVEVAEEVVRIISARQATRRESRLYAEFLQERVHDRRHP